MHGSVYEVCSACVGACVPKDCRTRRCEERRLLGTVTEHRARRRHIASKPEERTPISNIMGGLYSTDAAAAIDCCYIV